ncbi:hypothetical protein CXR26_13315 [Brevibacterium aurantiacum]|nr:hypothetical protein CXR26_13315 [Brevibacterium aurantiacum]
MDRRAMVEKPSPLLWERGDSLLEIVEQSTARATDDIVGAVSADRWQELKLTFQKYPGDHSWSVRANDFTGIAKLDIDGKPVHLRVTPKIEGLDLFFLADWAYGTRSLGKKLQDSRVDLAALRSEPAACLIGWYLAEVMSFATRWLRRGYVKREEDLVGRVRGRIDIARYLNTSIAQARPHVIPARFYEPSHDTPANRYLKAGLRKAAILARAVPLESARVALDELTRRALSLFYGVADLPANPQDALRLNLSGPLRHYGPIVSFTTALLEGTYLTTELGGHKQDAIMWSLNELYEQALRNVLRDWPTASLVQGKHRATITRASEEQVVSGSTPVKPDFVVRRADGSVLILDAKYKSVLTPTTSSSSEEINLLSARGPRIRVRRADIYQVVAYARHSELRTDKVVLLYPVSLAAGESFPPPLKVNEFSPTCHIAFFDVGPNAESNRSNLYDVLDHL